MWIDPIARTLEVFTLGADGQWGEPAIHHGATVVQAPPFAAIGLDRTALWA